MGGEIKEVNEPHQGRAGIAARPRHVAPRTVIEAFLPDAGEASLAEVYAAANRLGIADQPLRLAIRRMIAAGDVVQRGRGRSGALALTFDGAARLARDRAAVSFAFGQDARVRGAEALLWNGQWQLLSVSVPEGERSVRDAFRREVLELGAAPVATGLYVSPHELRELLSSEFQPYLTTAQATELVVRGESDPARIVETLWPSGPIRAAYAALAAAVANDVADRWADPVVRQLLLADALEKSLRADPLIPQELRGGDWEPARVRAQWADRWRDAQLSAGAVRLYEGWLRL